MKKIFIFYFFACAMMFVCLVAVFTILEIDQYLLPEGERDAQKPSAGAVEGEPPPFTLEEFKMDYEAAAAFSKPDNPKHTARYMYKVLVPVLMYDRLDFDNAYLETLVEGGIFLVKEVVWTKDNSWVYEVTVNNGRRDYQMFIPAASLDETEPYGTLAPNHLTQWLENMNELKVEAGANHLERAYKAALDAYHAEEAIRNPKYAPLEKLKSIGAKMSSFDSDGVTISVVAAGFVTLMVVFMLSSVVWMRNTRAWAPKVSFDDIGGSERGADYFEPEEEPDAQGAVSEDEEIGSNGQSSGSVDDLFS